MEETEWICSAFSLPQPQSRSDRIVRVPECVPFSKTDEGDAEHLELLQESDQVLQISSEPITTPQTSTSKRRFLNHLTNVLPPADGRDLSAHHPCSQRLTPLERFHHAKIFGYVALVWPFPISPETNGLKRAYR